MGNESESQAAGDKITDPMKQGMKIGCVLLFFSFYHCQKHFLCVLINWFLHEEEPDHDTSMWNVTDRDGPLALCIVRMSTVHLQKHTGLQS